jgi:PhnB protein
MLVSRDQKPEILTSACNNRRTFMKAIPYTTLNGNCEEAVKLYHSVLGGELFIMRFNEMPPEESEAISDAWKEKVMHSAITFDDGNVIYFSDSWEGSPVKIGESSTIHLAAESEKQAHDIFDKLSAGGSIMMPIEKTFWDSVYGNFVDKFGVVWSVEFAEEEQ